ncbi:MAG TPA: PQQ-binding-like beta-propeller repeat protein [Kofleriaceae bacterium]|nr:PQQ-binding-like beta-propeller repeat protein [Kofleriaceae bacterium]
MRHALTLPLLLVAACGGAGTFSLTGSDNNPKLLKAAFATAKPPTADHPLNHAGKPLLFASLSADKKKELVCYDLAAKKEVWRVASEVASKVAVGEDFVALREGDKTLVGHDIATGAKLWSIDLGGDFLGVAADAERVYYVVKTAAGTKPVWSLVGVSGKSGTRLWSADSPGQLGAPAARGGLVFSPFLKQWLAVLDGRTGEQLTRIRGLDQEIAFARATSDDVFFGSQQGVFLLDERAATGKKAQSTFGAANLPKEFVQPLYYWDAFDQVQTGYSAYDRNRILWRGEAHGENLDFKGGQVVLHSYRFFFGFDAKTGDLRWAYNHPRVDVVASEHTGGAIGFVSMEGDVGALDPTTGRRIFEGKINGRVLGATFDADGWKPTEKIEGDQQTTMSALMSIARDRDARFNAVKRFAVAALEKLQGGGVSGDLLTLIQDPRTPPNIYEKAVEVFVARKDPSGLGQMVEALSVEHDFITDTHPRAVGVIARAMANLAGLELDGTLRGRAVTALITQLWSPETPLQDLVEVVRALGALGAGNEIQPLRRFVILYRADPEFASGSGAMAAAIDVLLDRGGAAERELIAWVSAEGRTQEPVSAYARRALEQTARTK